MLIEVVPHVHTALQKFMWLQVTPPNRRLCLENNQLICTSVGDKKQLQLPVSEVILFWLRPWRACHNHVFQAAEDDRARVFRRWIARSQVLEFPVGLDDTSDGCYSCYIVHVEFLLDKSSWWIPKLAFLVGTYVPNSSHHFCGVSSEQVGGLLPRSVWRRIQHGSLEAKK